MPLLEKNRRADGGPRPHRVRHLLRNPGLEMCITALDDYRRSGMMAALDAIRTISDEPQVHACGCRLDTTLLSITAAAMALVCSCSPSR